jgi:phosphoribosylanthranilate isomerase
VTTVRVKICGITRKEDALAAVGAGADALGFMFYEGSTRFVSFPAAAEIIRALPPFVAKVGVFVNPSEAFLQQAVTVCGLDTVQLHGEETPEFCWGCRVPVMKAFRVKDRGSLSALTAFETAAWLLDSFVPGQIGGTGARFNWDLAIEAKQWGRPIVLAGGLTPDNVAEAVGQVRPYAVDVSSGVERTPGCKDIAKLQAFIAAARRA